MPGFVGAQYSHNTLTILSQSDLSVCVSAVQSNTEKYSEGSVQCAVCSVQCAVCSVVQCSVFYAVCSVQCAVCSV